MLRSSSSLGESGSRHCPDGPRQDVTSVSGCGALTGECISIVLVAPLSCWRRVQIQSTPRLSVWHQTTLETPFFPGGFPVSFCCCLCCLFAPRWLCAVFSVRETVRPMWPLSSPNSSSIPQWSYVYILAVDRYSGSCLRVRSGPARKTSASWRRRALEDVEEELPLRGDTDMHAPAYLTMRSVRCSRRRRLGFPWYSAPQAL